MNKFSGKFIEKCDFEEIISTFGCDILRHDSKSIKYHIDSFDVTNGEILVRGWAFSLKKKFSPDVIYIRVENAYQIFFCQIKRPDVQEVFKLNSQLVGFRAAAHIDNVRSKGLRMGFVSENSLLEFDLE